MLPTIIIIVCILIGFIFHYHLKTKAFKQEIVTKVLNELFQNVTYEYNSGFNKKRIFDTKLVMRGNVYKSDDYIRAVYKGISFEFADVVIEDEVQNGEHTTTHTYFYGQWLIVKNTKMMRDKLYIIDKNFGYSNPNSNIFKKEYEKIKLESTEFNKEFNVYGKDAHEAFYIINPQLIMKLLEIHKDNVSFYMDPEEIHIAIYSKKNFFKPKVFGNNDYEVDREIIMDSVMKTLSYLDIFKL